LAVAAGATEAGSVIEQFSYVQTFGYEDGMTAFGAGLATDFARAGERRLEQKNEFPLCDNRNGSRLRLSYLDQNTERKKRRKNGAIITFSKIFQVCIDPLCPSSLPMENKQCGLSKAQNCFCIIFCAMLVFTHLEAYTRSYYSTSIYN
jgi:hypothetical protein